MPGNALFFRSPKELRTWFKDHHASAPELWAGFYKVHTGRAGLRYDDVVGVALCFGWIDTTVRRMDAKRYANRFTPRQPGSRWSRVNLQRFRALERAGRVVAAGHEAFAQRAGATGAYSYESRPRTLPPGFLRRLRSNPAAWEFFSTRPPGYRRLAAFWVMSARRAETRERRLNRLIEASAQGRRPLAFEVEAGPRQPGKSTRVRSPAAAPGSR